MVGKVKTQAAVRKESSFATNAVAAWRYAQKDCVENTLFQVEIWVRGCLRGCKHGGKKFAPSAERKTRFGCFLAATQQPAFSPHAGAQSTHISINTHLKTQCGDIQPDRAVPKNAPAKRARKRTKFGRRKKRCPTIWSRNGRVGGKEEKQRQHTCLMRFLIDDDGFFTRF
jgi:hypothetical protein